MGGGKGYTTKLGEIMDDLTRIGYVFLAIGGILTGSIRIGDCYFYGPDGPNWDLSNAFDLSSYMNKWLSEIHGSATFSPRRLKAEDWYRVEIQNTWRGTTPTKTRFHCTLKIQSKPPNRIEFSLGEAFAPRGGWGTIQSLYAEDVGNYNLKMELSDLDSRDKYIVIQLKCRGEDWQAPMTEYDLKWNVESYAK